MTQQSTEQQSARHRLGNNLLDCLDRSRLTFEPTNCHLCGGQTTSPVHSVSFLNHTFNFVRCQACSLIYQHPRLTQESLDQIYESLEYWEHANSSSAADEMLNYYSYLDDIECRRKNAEFRIKWINKYLPENSRILDLGCSDGLFVNTLAQGGYQASGIDISASMIAHAQQTYDIDARQADFTKDWPFKEKFDAVCCFAALSNFFNPSDVFKNIQKHTTPGGSFFFNFGDGDRICSKLLGKKLYLYRPTVRTIYSLKTIKRYLNQYGFRLDIILNDQQFITLPRLLGFFRIPGMLKLTKNLKLDNVILKIHCLTGYLARAVYEG